MFMGDSVISAVDNTAWKEQRNHMTQAFLPMSSLAHIFPVSNDRAIACADILKRISQGGTQKINMSEFYLNETQQQLHLALCEYLPTAIVAQSVTVLLLRCFSTRIYLLRPPQSARATKILTRITTQCSVIPSADR